MAITDAAVGRFEILREGFLADAAAVAREQEVDRKRKVVTGEMLSHLRRYSEGEINNEEFRATFDSKTRNEWKGFGFKGASGAMFLNMLVKYVPDQEALAKQLRKTLRLPADTEAGKEAMRGFADFLAGVINAGHATKQQIHPARTPFLVSGWWHLQAPEAWPIYFSTGRKVLAAEGVFAETGKPVEDYFAFRECFRELARTLGLNSWDFEHVLAWQSKQGGSKPPPTIPKVDPNGEGDGEEAGPVAFEHAQVQYLLAKIGRKLGCHVWIAVNDHSKEWVGKKLGELSIKELPTLGLDPATQATIKRIDVLWIQGTHQVTAAFEIENTTSIYSGLLRLSDLVTQSPNLNFPLYIVAPESRMDKVRRELSRPTFQALELHKRCGYFSNAALVENADAIMLWAGGPSAIDQLADKVDDVGEAIE